MERKYTQVVTIEIALKYMPKGNTGFGSKYCNYDKINHYFVYCCLQGDLLDNLCAILDCYIGEMFFMTANPFYGADRVRWVVFLRHIMWKTCFCFTPDLLYLAVG